MYDGHSLVDVLLTSTLLLLVFRGALSLRAEKISFWPLENEDAFCMMTSSSYSKKRSFFTTDIINRYTYIVERSVSMVNYFTLNRRHIFSHSVKEHPYYSRYRINTLVANWIFFAVSFI